jgi:transcriptional regulator GlxA family with amidase domain
MKMLRTNILANKPVDAAPNITRMRRIGFLVYPDIEALDICGPLGAFAYADYYLREAGRTGEPGYEVLVIAASPGPVRTQSGLQIVATHGCGDVTQRLDTLIVVGGVGAEAACADQTLFEWLRATAPRVRRLASVCTGAFLLAAAGLLNDRRVTTHWMFCDRLAELHPSLCIEPDLIFVRDGHVYTSGGITSGIDLALALIEEDLGRDIAMAVARMMVVFLRRPGGQSQFSPFLYAEAKIRGDIRGLQTWILAHPAERLDVETLADRLAMSPRNFARLFRSETRVTPGKFVELARLAAARCMLEQTTLPAGAIAEGCGFGTEERMRRSFQRHLRVGPQNYRKRFQSALAALESAS